MSNQIFRKKSLERVSSPEELNEYVRVIRPSALILTAAIIIVMVGGLIWANFGMLESRINTVVSVNDGVATCIVQKSAVDVVTSEMFIEISDEEFPIGHVALTTGESGLQYEIMAEARVANGVYDAWIVKEKIRPMDLFFKK